MVRANPGRSSNHSDNSDHNTDNAPGKHYLRCVLLDMVLEGANDREDEPRNSRGGTPRVNPADVLKEACPEDTHPQRRPLYTSKSTSLRNI